MKAYYVYILTNRINRVLYTGITNDLLRRVHEHRKGNSNGFTRRYHVYKLVYYETYEDIESASIRVKQIKGGSRQGKIDLINSMNPNWVDLFHEMHG